MHTMLTRSRRELWKNDSIRTCIVRSIGLLLIAAGFLALGSWSGLVQLPNLILSELQAISPFTDMGFVLLGANLLLAPQSTSRSKPSLIGMVLLAGAVTATLHTLWRPEFGIDQLLLREDSHRGSIRHNLFFGSTFLIASLVVLFGRQLVTRQPRIYDLLILVGALWPAIGVFIFIFQSVDPAASTRLFDSGFAVSLGQLLYFTGASMMYRESAISRLFVYATHGGRQFRRLVFPLILGPLLLGWIVQQAVFNGALDPALGIALFAGVFCLSMLIILTWNARCEDYWFRELNAEHEAKIEAQFQLSLALDAAGAIIVFGEEGRIKSVNRGASHIFGWSSAEMLGMYISDLVPTHSESRTGEEPGQFHWATDNPRVNDSPQKMMGLSRDGLDVPLLVTISEHRVGDEVLYGAVMMRTDDLANQMYQLTREMNIDSLTAIENRHSFDITLLKTQTHGLRQHRNMALLMLDIDYFKRVNDTHGHASGDIVLAEFAARCSACLRFSDRIFRYGGEEFVILADDANPNEARRLAERIRTETAATPISCNGVNIWITCSIGISSVDKKNADLTRCLRQADQALYLAKEAGRNRTVIYQHAELVKSA